MSRYTADTEQILAFVEKAKQIGHSIEQRISGVEREIEALHVEWEGDAAVAHKAKHDTWNREIQEMKSALGALEMAARAARDRYLANVRHNMGMWP